MPHPRTAEQLARHALEQRLRREVATKSGHPLESHPREAVYARTRGKCTVCRKQVDPSKEWHEEHIVALFSGGTNDISNLGPAHPECNLAKGTG